MPAGICRRGGAETGMRYAVISDLHGNRQALKAVLIDLRSVGVDQLICLGDCVGYGPCPAEVLESAYAHVHHFTLGNHDAVIAGRLAADCFNDRARAIIDWTQSALDRKSADFFNALPLVVYDQDFACTHAEFEEPGVFNYVFEAAAARPSFDACSEQALFIGHSHVPGLFVLGGSGVPHWLEPIDFSLEPGKRYLVNVGSVGQPRDRDIRASYVVFDSATGSVFFRKVPFDVDGYRDDLRRRRVSPEASYFLQLDRQMQPPPLRELVNFRPARSGEFVAGENDVRTLETSLRRLKRSNRRLWTLSFLLVLSTLGALGLTFGRRVIDPDISLTIPAMAETVCGAGVGVNEYFLAMPALTADMLAAESDGGTAIGSDYRMLHWSVVLGDPEYQQVYLTQADNRAQFRLVSDNSQASIRLVSSTVSMRRGQRMRVMATLFNQAVEQGFAEIYGEYIAPDGTVRRLASSTEHQLHQLTRWSPRAATCEPLREDGMVRLVLHAQFQGELRVRDMAMVRR